MSTRNTQSTRVNAACRAVVNERLDITLGQDIDLGQVSVMLGTGRVDLSGLRALAGDAELRSVLGRLAPLPYARARAVLAGKPGTANLSSQVMSARAELADAVTTARTAIADATRDITVEAFAGAATELGYTHTVSRGQHVTGLELWRDNELLLLRIRNDGTVESDHAGLTDGTCVDRQRELEQAAARRGLEFSDRKQFNHGAAEGGDLIRAAVARQVPGSSLAQAAVTDYEQPIPTQGSRLFGTAQAAPSHRAREIRRNGAS
jgi:hypothetical protein